MQPAGEQTVERVTDASGDEQPKRPFELIIEHVHDDERHENEPHQRELVGSSPEPRDHRRDSPVRNSAASWPHFILNRSSIDGTSPLRSSSSMRSMRCIGKKTADAVTLSPSRTWRTKSSKESSPMPRRLTPAWETEMIAPQNFSRGELSVMSTGAPG